MGLLKSIKKGFKKIWKGVKKGFAKVGKFLNSDLGKIVMLALTVYSLGTATGFIGGAAKAGGQVAAEAGKQAAVEAGKQAVVETGKQAAVEAGKQAAVEAAKPTLFNAAQTAATQTAANAGQTTGLLTKGATEAVKGGFSQIPGATAEGAFKQASTGLLNQGSQEVAKKGALETLKGYGSKAVSWIEKNPITSQALIGAGVAALTPEEEEEEKRYFGLDRNGNGSRSYYSSGYVGQSPNYQRTRGA